MTVNESPRLCTVHVIPAEAGIQSQKKYLDSLAELGQAHFPWPTLPGRHEPGSGIGGQAWE